MVSGPLIATDLAMVNASFDPTTRAQPIVGGKYRVVRRLARGGMGTVFEAIQESLGRRVALKVLRGELCQSPRAVQRFEREARTLARLKHPNTVVLHDFGHTREGLIYLVLEYVDGVPLQRLIGGGLSPTRAARLALQVARALSEAHPLGIVHRDLKPANILVSAVPDFDSVKVVDFGLAKLVDGDRSPLTRSEILGTPRYMAPEQIRAEPVCPATDVYALGLVLFEMLAGRPAFAAKAPSEVFLAQLSQQPPPLPRHVDSELVALVEQCLEKDAVARPPDGAAVAARLEKWLEQQRIDLAYARADTLPPRPELAQEGQSEALVRAVPGAPAWSSSRGWWAAAAWTLLLACLLLGWLLLKGPRVNVVGATKVASPTIVSPTIASPTTDPQPVAVPRPSAPDPVPEPPTPPQPTRPRAQLRPAVSSATVSEERAWQGLRVESGPESDDFWRPRLEKMRAPVARCRRWLTEPTRIRVLTIEGNLGVTVRPLSAQPEVVDCFRAAAAKAELPPGVVLSFEVAP